MLDATLLLAGNLNAAFDVALVNDKSLTDDLLVGEVISYTTDMGVQEQEISKVLTRNGIATAV